MKKRTKSLQERHPLFARWKHMMASCYYEPYPNYHNVGGKGIRVDPRLHKFWNYAKAVERHFGLPPMGSLSRLARKDQTKDWTISNMEWATSKEVGRRNFRTVRITYKRKTLCLTEWAEHLGINVFTLSSRLENGWSVEQAFGLKPGPKALAGLKRAA